MVIRRALKTNNSARRGTNKQLTSARRRMGLISSLAIFYCSSDSRFDESQLKVKPLSMCKALHNVNRTNNNKNG